MTGIEQQIWAATFATEYSVGITNGDVHITFVAQMADAAVLAFRKLMEEDRRNEYYLPSRAKCPWTMED